MTSLLPRERAEGRTERTETIAWASGTAWPLEMDARCSTCSGRRAARGDSGCGAAAASSGTVSAAAASVRFMAGVYESAGDHGERLIIFLTSACKDLASKDGASSPVAQVHFSLEGAAT